ncbi:MAG: putative Ig domain-containing protein, partial [Clostridia bacterium]|nr:putative Ig domain-containing protein [Clostridia bacterium]
MKKNCKTGKRIISLLVTLAMCMSIVPVVLADAPTSEGWTVRQFDDLRIYKHAAADSADASRITSKIIDLSDPLHFYYGISGISYDGFALMRMESANDKTVPVAGVTIADEGFYQLDGSTSSGSWYEYFRSSDAESVKNYNDDGSYTEATYDDGTTKYDHGMYLQYEAGNKTKYYIKPGYYRFVHFHRQAQTITYSDVYQITDKNGVYTEPGSADVSFTANGFDTPVNSLLSDDTFDMAITSLKGADGNDISLNSADVTNIEFLTNYWYIPINGSSLDSVVSYEYSYSYPMYNGSEVADGRTLVKTNDAITLKNCTAKWIVKGNNIASLLSDGEIYKYRVKVTAKVGGEEKVFMTDAPIKITAAYSVTTIITDSLNKGSIGVAYNAQLSGATPDKSELKWTVDSGELPPGLSLTQSGQIPGTPTTAGTYKFKVKMTATGDGTSDTKEYTIVITKRQLSGY